MTIHSSSSRPLAIKVVVASSTPVEPSVEEIAHFTVAALAVIGRHAAGQVEAGRAAVLVLDVCLQAVQAGLEQGPGRC